MFSISTLLAVYNGRRTSKRRFRDIGWYHIVIVVDTSLSIGDKIKVYVNGDQITDFDTKTNIHKILISIQPIHFLLVDRVLTMHLQ